MTDQKLIDLKNKIDQSEKNLENLKVEEKALLLHLQDKYNINSIEEAALESKKLNDMILKLEYRVDLISDKIEKLLEDIPNE